MMVAFFYFVFCGLLSILITPLIWVSDAWFSFTAMLASISVYLDPYISIANIFINTSTLLLCLSGIFLLETLILIWEAFSTFVLRK